MLSQVYCKQEGARQAVKKRRLIIIAGKAQELPLALELNSKFKKAEVQVKVISDDDVALAADYKRDEIRPLYSYRGMGNIKYRDIWRDFHSLFSKWGKEPILGSTNLRELTRYRGVSLWETSFADMLYKLIPILDKVSVVEELFNAELPDEVIAFNGDSLLEEIILLYCKQKNIAVRIYPPGKEKAVKNELQHKWFFLEPLIRTKKFLVSIYYCLINYFKRLRKIKGKPKIIFFAFEERSLDTLLPAIQLFSPLERLVINSVLPGSSRLLSRNGVYAEEFYGYLLNYPFNRQVDSFLQKVWEALESDKRFQEGISYKGLFLWGVIRPLFNFLFMKVFINKIYRIEVTEKIIRSYSPEVIVLPHNIPDIILTAKKLNVPVATLQSASPEEFIYFGPIASDIITVDAAAWKDLLVKNGIPQEKISVTGSSKFDTVFNRMLLYTPDDKKRFFHQMGLDENKKLVVLAGNHIEPSICLFRQHYRDTILTLYNAIKGVEGVQLLVKPHPFEFDFKVYSEMALKAGLTPPIILKDIDKWELLVACDLLIDGFFSTMSFEATIMNKPVLNLLDINRFAPTVLTENNVWDFKDSKAVVNIDDQNELKERIRDILYNPECALELERNRRSYIQRHLDFSGESSCRIRKVIEGFLKGADKNG